MLVNSPFHNHPFYYHCFDPSWLGLISNEWLPNQLPHSPAIAQITPSSPKIFLPFSEGNCFCTLWNETLFQSLNVFHATENCIPCKINYHAPYDYKCLNTLLQVFYKFLEANRHSQWTWYFCLWQPDHCHWITSTKNLSTSDTHLHHI